MIFRVRTVVTVTGRDMVLMQKRNGCDWTVEPHETILWANRRVPPDLSFITGKGGTYELRTRVRWS